MNVDLFALACQIVLGVGEVFLGVFLALKLIKRGGCGCGKGSSGQRR